MHKQSDYIFVAATSARDLRASNLGGIDVNYVTAINDEAPNYFKFKSFMSSLQLKTVHFIGLMLFVNLEETNRGDTKNVVANEKPARKDNG